MAEKLTTYDSAATLGGQASAQFNSTEKLGLQRMNCNGSAAEKLSRWWNDMPMLHLKVFSWRRVVGRKVLVRERLKVR